MNIAKTHETIIKTAEELRREADALHATADMIERAGSLIGLSSSTPTAVKKVTQVNRLNRMSESARNRAVEWLKEGKKTIKDISASVGVTRAAVYQLRDKMGLNTYKKTHA